MANNSQLLQGRLKKAGYSNTQARQLVFAALDQPEPQTIRQLTNRVSKQVDRASVYRTISLFEQLGIVHRITIGWKYKLELSDQFVAHHHHLSCLGCGKTIDIGDEKHIDDFIKEVAANFGFEPRRHQFEVDGYCSTCKNQAH